MQTKARKGRVIAVGMVIAIAGTMYWLAGGVMNWLRVTLHGR